MRVPTPSFAAIGPGLVLLRNYGNLSAVQELEKQQENLVPNRVHRNHSRIPGPAGRGASRAHGPMPGGGRGDRVEPAGGRVRPAEELAEEEATRGEDAAVRVDQTPLHVEGDVAEGLAVDQEVEVIKGERSHRLF